MKNYDLEEAARQYRDEFLDKNDNDISKYDIEDIFIAGVEWQYEQFEKNRLSACDNMTKEEADREQEFTTNFIEKNNCIPTYSDAIEYGRKQLIDKACEWLKNNVEKYIYNATPYPDADFKACVGGKCWEYFRKAMKGE